LDVVVEIFQLQLRSFYSSRATFLAYDLDGFPSPRVHEMYPELLC